MKTEALAAILIIASVWTGASRENTFHARLARRGHRAIAGTASGDGPGTGGTPGGTSSGDG